MNALVTVDLEHTTRQVQMLAAYFGADLSPAVLRLYIEGLRDVPAEHLQAGCRRLVNTSSYMPKVADIRRAIDAELRDRRVVQEPPTDAPDVRHCHQCNDTGWYGPGLHEPVSPGVHPVVRRCPCYQTNPVLARQRQPKSYAEAEA